MRKLFLIFTVLYGAYARGAEPTETIVHGDQARAFKQTESQYTRVYPVLLRKIALKGADRIQIKVSSYLMRSQLRACTTLIGKNGVSVGTSCADVHATPGSWYHRKFAAIFRIGNPAQPSRQVQENGQTVWTLGREFFSDSQTLSLPQIQFSLTGDYFYSRIDYSVYEGTRRRVAYAAYAYSFSYFRRPIRPATVQLHVPVELNGGNPFPMLVLRESFDGLPSEASTQRIVSNNIGLDFQTFSSKVCVDIDCEEPTTIQVQVEGASASEAFARRGGAYRLTTRATNPFRRMVASGTININASDLGLARIGSWRLEADVAVSKTRGNQVAASQETSGFFERNFEVSAFGPQVPGGQINAGVQVSRRFNSNFKWFLHLGRFFSIQDPLATNTSMYQFVRVLSEYNENSGELTVQSGPYLRKKNYGANLNFTNILLLLATQDRYPDAAPHVTQPLLLDNLRFEVLSGRFPDP